MIHYWGISENRSARVVSEIIKGKKVKSLLITANTDESESLAGDLSFFVDRNIYLMPADENVFIRYEAKSREERWQRASAVNALLREEDCIIISPVSAIMRKFPPAQFYQKREIFIDKEISLPHGELVKGLLSLGYERLPATVEPGQFSVRGAVIDFFPPDKEFPIRLEYYDDSLESIREFDPKNQRSRAELPNVKLYPICEFSSFAEEAMEGSFLWQYLGERDYLIFEDPAGIYEEAGIREEEETRELEMLISLDRARPDEEALIKRQATIGNLLFSKEESKGEAKKIVLSAFLQLGLDIRIDDQHEINSRPSSSYHGNIESLVKDLKEYEERDYRIIISYLTEERKRNLEEIFAREGLSKIITFKEGSLSKGMEFLDEKLLYLAERDIFVSGKKSKRWKRNFRDGQVIRAFTDLREGDFVVHENHGIGKFTEIKQLTIDGARKDYLKIQYQGQDLLYVPVEQMASLQKYIGSEGLTPKLNKLSGSDWKKTKLKARGAAYQLAKELIERSAKRLEAAGYAFAPDSPWQKEFEEDFPYEETEDQLRSIEEIKKDMESPKPMDRLLCGDVGFGKTEVALRAIFKCVAEGKQAAILVPTTLLANQHYKTMIDRFSKYPFKIGTLSRFNTDKEEKDTLDGLKKGDIDIVVGTHRLLSKDIEFDDLGLLIIDEEQKFGVAHKETIKSLKSNVDVLALSATPIPRTLHMSLTGIRDMSIIEDPPEERYPVKTYVMEEDDLALKEAILQEIKRRGQVYVVYNRVRGLARILRNLQALVPQAKIALGHGQMGERDLEDVMTAFLNREIDVLLSTTIIESGLDIANVNTIIILEADHYGLASLYQLRGRVGRSNRLAYAYLFYKRGKSLTEAAGKRLRAIREFTELGAGFKISMQDLEIRGAGNLLGPEQSGHLMTVGYELYVRMLEDAIKALKGEAHTKRRGETSVELKVSAYIADSYIEDEILKLEMYKKIADIESREDLLEVSNELRDRFGDLPPEVEAILKISLIRSQGEKLGVRRIWEENGEVFFKGNTGPPVKRVFAKEEKLEGTLHFMERLVSS